MKSMELGLPPVGGNPARAEAPLKKKLRGLLALGLCLCLTLGLLPTPAQAAGPTGSWGDAGNVDTGWYNSTDTEFTLTTAKQLAGLASLVSGGNSFTGKTVRLGADIDLSAHFWTPIGNMDKPWAGVFDGARRTVSGITVSEKNVSSYEEQVTGFFRQIGTGGSVHSLRISGASIEGESTANLPAGILTGINNGGTIYDCAVSGSISGSANDSSSRNVYVGGLVGENRGGAVVKNCSAQLTSISASLNKTSGTCSVGGIVGFGTGTVENCYADADAATVSTGGATAVQYRIAPAASYSYWDDATQLTDGGTPTYTQCYAVTAEQIAGTATAIIGQAADDHANTPSLLTALNNWTAANAGYSPWNRKDGIPIQLIFAPNYLDIGVVPEQNKDSATGTLDADVKLHGQVQENAQLLSVTLPATIPFIMDMDSAGALRRVLSATATLTNRSDMGVTVTLTSVTDPDALLTKVDLSLVPDPVPASGNVALSVGTGKTDVLSTLAAQTGGVPATSTLKVDGAAKAGVPSVGSDGDTFTVGLTLKVSKT